VRVFKRIGPSVAAADGVVDCTPDGRRQRDQDHFGAFAAGSQDAVAVFLAEVGDVGAGGFEDPQAEQAEHCDEGEVACVRRFAAGGEHCFELQVCESERGRFWRHCWPPDMLGG
jgi:hypothetical protein